MNPELVVPPPAPVDRLEGLAGYRRAPLPSCVDLRLDGNEGLLPDPGLARSFADDPGVASLLRGYPSARRLEERLADRFGVENDRVLVLAGGDEVLDRAFRAYTEPGRNAVWSVPSFEMLPHYARLSGCQVRNPVWTGGAWPCEEILAAMDPTTGLVILVSPNNPTGGLITGDQLRVVAEAAPHALVVLDHAYAEFTDHDLTEVALALSNVVVLRTLSKAYGLAGLRVGYALGDARVLSTLRAAGGPFSVSSPSLDLAERALDAAPETARGFVARVRDEREDLAARLRGHGLGVDGSNGNFVLARDPRVHWLREGLLGLGIAVRTFPGRAWLEDAVRITCPGNRADYDRLIDAIDAVLAPQALLVVLEALLTDGDRPRVDAPTWTGWARRLQLAIVTDRDEATTARLLADHGLADATRAVVPRDSETSLRAVLAGLGARRAWLLGATPSDLEQARAAGIVPLALSSRGPLAPDDRALLLQSGAARVFDDPRTLEDLFA